MRTTIRSVEVHWDKADRKWAVSVHYVESPIKWVIAKRRLRSRALLIGTGAAMALQTEFKPTNRKGEYTKEAASFGNDPTDVPG